LELVKGFLSNTKTFHDVYAPLTTPAIVPTLTFLVEYGHLLIGLSLIFGLMVRVQRAFRHFDDAYVLDWAYELSVHR
jgi:thiosulfate dehydrogenase (quinone) large subunit